MSPPTNSRLAIDRIACSGHGVCAQIVPDQIVLDEWGYPIISADHVTRDAEQAIEFCPARALFLQR